MTVSTTPVKTVVLVWMASTISRVTAFRGILGVNARQVCRFEAKIWLSYKSKFPHYNTSVTSNNNIISVVLKWLHTWKKQRILIFNKKKKKNNMLSLFALIINFYSIFSIVLVENASFITLTCCNFWHQQFHV